MSVERFDGMDTAQADVPVGEAITVEELLNRAKVQAMIFSPNSQTRLLIANMSRVIIEITCRLDAAERLIKDNNLEVPKTNIVFMPSRES